MTVSKYEELKTAIRDYGQAAFQNVVRCRALGEAIASKFHEFEGCPKENVAAVPAQGEFDPLKDYGEEAFSPAGREVIILEPVRFGIVLIVGNTEDSGALWLRTIISIEVIGETFDIFVASQPVIRVPFAFEGKLDPVFDAVHREFLETFTLEVNEFNDTRFKTGIGFLRG